MGGDVAPQDAPSLGELSAKRTEGVAPTLMPAATLLGPALYIRRRQRRPLSHFVTAPPEGEHL